MRDGAPRCYQKFSKLGWSSLAISVMLEIWDNAAEREGGKEFFPDSNLRF